MNQQQQQMQPLEALAIMENAAAQARLTLQDHALVDVTRPAAGAPRVPERR